MMERTTCENCHKRATRRFTIREPNVRYRLNGTDEASDDSWLFCNASCAKSFAAWMFGPGLTKMPKGWKVEEIK